MDPNEETMAMNEVMEAFCPLKMIISYECDSYDLRFGLLVSTERMNREVRLVFDENVSLV